MGVGTNAAAGVAVGDVVETMDAGGYTYVLIDTGAEKIWAAGPKCTVKVGDKLSVSKSMPMPNWESKTLNRQFDIVYFVTGFQKPDGTPLAAGGHGMASGHGMAGGLGAKQATGATGETGATGAKIEAVEKAEGGKTVAEIFAGKEELAGKEVTFRGKVTKYNPQIMKKNWLHVQDGSGDRAAGTHDLTVTTASAAKVGDTVLVTGTVQIDKDFSMGYKYDVIVEDAKVVVE